jgi:diguanylate cyclase (GGDEF)-like protein
VRLAAITALLLGIALLAGSVALGEHDSTQRQVAVDHALRRAVDVELSQLAEYFGRARAIDLITARNPAFRAFYAEPGSREAKVRARVPAVRGAEDALVYLERLYPDGIGEACFIDRGGAENARAVKGHRASFAMLSKDESRNPFFAPTFRLRPGQVYQAKPYVSPDTQEWVISNSTPLPGSGYPAKAIVHYEITVESLRREAAASAGDARILVVDSHTGRVILDTTRPQERGMPLGEPDDHRFVPLVGTFAGAGIRTLGSSRAAFRHLPRGANNQNDWVVVAERPQPAALVGGVGWAAIGMAAAALALLAFAGFSFRSSRRTLHRAAHTDALTGLANRRRLMLDLEQACASATAEAPYALVLYDLDGFKNYNDLFGHLPGDALLRRLGHKLEAAIGRAGTAYRLGGDEFCVLAPLTAAMTADAVCALGAEALAETGEGFAVSSSFGVILVPQEGRAPSDVLATVDTRMYAAKQGGRRSVARQTTDILVRVQHECSRELGPHASGVGELAARVGEALGLAADRVGRLRLAAELHDIGKIAIPSAILDKPGPLDDDEWNLMREHTLIGERMLSVAPAMRDVASIVRWSHERVDGTGYPDGLAGDELPLEARIVAAADAYAAMTSDRAYRPARPHEVAAAELRRSAGTQLDPVVVETLLAVLAAETADLPRAA